MQRFLSQLFAAKKSASRRPAAPQARPGVELLEGRELPSSLGHSIAHAVISSVRAGMQIQQVLAGQNSITLGSLLQVSKGR
jgi:hypothetical protein